MKQSLLELESALITNFAKYSTAEGTALSPEELYYTFQKAGFVPNTAEDATTLYGLVDKISSTLAEKNGSTKGQKLNIIMDFVQFFGSIASDVLETEMQKFNLFIKVSCFFAKNSKRNGEFLNFLEFCKTFEDFLAFSNFLECSRKSTKLKKTMQPIFFEIFEKFTKFSEFSIKLLLKTKVLF